MVFNGLGNKVKTAGGFTKADLMKTKTGKIITKRQHARGKKAYKNIKGWTVAVQKAKKELNLKGFVAVRRGTPLYETAKASTIGASASSSITSMAKSSTIARGKRQKVVVFSGLGDKVKTTSGFRKADLMKTKTEMFKSSW